MTDMRATERLLEVIEESILLMQREFVGGMPGSLANAHEAITELRRRGDTLVRSRDLAKVLSKAGLSEPYFGEGESVDDFLEARDRLEIALGGKLR